MISLTPAIRHACIGAAPAALLAGLLIPATAAAAPAFETVRESWRPSQAWLLDRHGEVLHEMRMDFRGRRLPWVPLERLSPVLVKAIIHAEDRDFREHGGVDWAALARAAAGSLAGERRGASTLTMQLAGLLDPALRPGRGGRSVSQKLAQLTAARDIEARWTKDQILEAYLNLTAWRGELNGIGAAAAGLFGKAPAALDEAESLLLAALLPSPNATPERVARRACALAAGGFRPGCEELKRLAVRALGQAPELPPGPALAPELARELLKEPGQRLTTTLDAGLQRRAREILAGQLLELAPRRVRDGALVVVDNASGQVLAYVGSGGPASTARHVDGARAPRQAGSTLKPFLYGLALEQRLLTAASPLDDTPIALPAGAGLYVPQNYDGGFKGLVSLRTALASSLNIPAVRTLGLVGLDAFHGRLLELGYAGLSRDPEWYGHSLALGSAEVSLLEQVAAYRTLARGGRWGPLGFLPGAPVQGERQVMDPDAAWLVGDILADRGARALTFGLASPLATRAWSAVKTGTSKGMRDNWCLGWTRRHTVGVWVGNFEGEAMEDVSGISGAAPVWQALVDLLEGGSEGAPPAPPGLRREAVRLDTGAGAEGEREEWFLAGTRGGRIEVLAAAARSPRIVYPASGTILALDPDLAPGRQALLPRVEGDGAAGLVLALDGAPLAGPDPRWHPRRGHHVLTLAEPDGRLVDRVEFEVR